MEIKPLPTREELIEQAEDLLEVLADDLANLATITQRHNGQVSYVYAIEMSQAAIRVAAQIANLEALRAE